MIKPPTMTSYSHPRFHTCNHGIVMRLHLLHPRILSPKDLPCRKPKDLPTQSQHGSSTTFMKYPLLGIPPATGSTGSELAPAPANPLVLTTNTRSFTPQTNICRPSTTPLQQGRVFFLHLPHLLIITGEQR